MEHGFISIFHDNDTVRLGKINRLNFLYFYEKTLDDFIKFIKFLFFFAIKKENFFFRIFV